MSSKYQFIVENVRPNGELYWICPLYIKAPGQKYGSFIADVQAYTPIMAAGRAAALGQMIVQALERQLSGFGDIQELHGDGRAFAEFFQINTSTRPPPADAKCPFGSDTSTG